jgi:hypothetical protein
LACGGNDHQRNSCRFQQTKCNACGRIGHIKRACLSLTRQTTQTPTSTHQQ